MPHRLAPLRRLAACLFLPIALLAAGGTAAAQERQPVLDRITRLPAAVPVQDWLTAGDPTEMPVRPANGSTVLQSPPGFTWPDVAPAAGYRFRLSGPDGLTVERDSPRNSLLLDRVLPAGSYDWQVAVAGQSGQGWSAKRRFEVPEGAVPFPVPDIATLWQRARAAPHPRLLPRGEAWTRHRADLLQGRRAALFARVQDAVTARSGRLFQPPSEDRRALPAGDMEPGWWPQPGEERYRGELEALERAAMVWKVTGDPAILDDARARLQNVLSWPADGAVALHRNDQLAMDHAWGIAVAYDLLYDQLSPSERARAAAAVAASAVPAYRWFLDNSDRPQARMQARPQNSHGYGHLANLAALSVIFAGELAQAESWFEAAVPLLLAMPHPWGGDDGGSGNGGNYAFYYMVDLIPRWDALRNGIGIDPADSAWARHFPLYASYFQGPGSRFAFGDGSGHGDAGLTGTVMRSLYARTGSRLARWYSLQVPQSYPIPHMMELTAPPAGPLATEGPDPAALPDAAVLPSIGWAALHSDIQSRDRASIFFRSGPFGSDGHNDADQNSFIIDLNRRRMAIDSGYYVTYDSPHMLGWTRRTQAHNAITFDGGQGQPIKRADLAGRITAFADDGRLASVTGDATAAYDGALETAVRTIALLRPDIVLVYDRVASDTPRSFEWNLHSHVEMVRYAANAAGIAQDNTSLCVELLAPQEIDFTQTDRFGDPDRPPARADLPRQWHARFATRDRLRQTEFLALLRLNCRAMPVRDLTALPGGGFRLEIGNNAVQIGAGRAVLNPTADR